MTATLGSLLVSAATLTVERYGIPDGDLVLMDDTTPALGSSQTLTIGDLASVGAIVTGGDFGGQARVRWCGGAGGLDAKGNGVSAWAMKVASRPYHNDGGVMLSSVFADLERDAAVACGATPIGAVLEVPDVQIDNAGSWVRPAAVARDLLDALATAAGQPRGAWWIASDGSTHLGPRPVTSTTLSNLTVGDCDLALLRATAACSDDGISTLLPGTTLSAPGLPTAGFPIAALTVRVSGEDIGVELWGEASHAELFARVVRHVMAPRVDYLPLQPATVTGTPDAQGRVPMTAIPFGSAYPDAPAIACSPGLPGSSFTLPVGANIVVACLAGNPGNPVVVSYPAGPLPISVTIDATGAISIGPTATSVQLTNGIPEAVTPMQAVAQRRVVCYGDDVSVGTATGPLTLLGPTASRARG